MKDNTAFKRAMMRSEEVKRDKEAAFGRTLARIAENKMTQREERIAEQNFKLGKRIGHDEGYEQGLRDGEIQATDLTLAGALITGILCALAGFTAGVLLGPV